MSRVTERDARRVTVAASRRSRPDPSSRPRSKTAILHTHGVYTRHLSRQLGGNHPDANSSRVLRHRGARLAGTLHRSYPPCPASRRAAWRSRPSPVRLHSAGRKASMRRAFDAALQSCAETGHRRSGGIGRRAGFKIPFWQQSEGSSPSSGSIVSGLPLET